MHRVCASAVVIAVAVSVCLDSFRLTGGGLQAADFRRGDTDADGQTNISDAIGTLGFLFLGQPTRLPCRDAADADDSGGINLTDAIYLLSYLFLGAAAPPAPFPGCGPDPTEDALECERFAPCLGLLGELTVVSTPDAAHAATETIGRLGGSVETDAADGTHYELSVPAGALDAEVDITIAPTSVVGLEEIAESVPYAVELSPAGLTFAIPATLLITPPVGAPSLESMLFASWQEGAGIEVRPPLVAPDGTLQVPIDHFSGAATLEARIEHYTELIEFGISGLLGIGSDAQLQAHIAAGNRQAIADDLWRLYGLVVDPSIEAVTQGPLVAGLVNLGEAKAFFNDWRVTANVLDIEGFTPTGKTTNLELLIDDARLKLIAKGETLRNHWLTPICDGFSEELLDWLAIPISIQDQINELGLETNLPADPFCIRAHVEILTPFPARIEPSQRTLTATFRGGVTAPGSTPGGTLVGGLKFFPQRTEFDLAVEGAIFTGDDSTLLAITGIDGTLSVECDRGADEESRAPRVTIDGCARVGLAEQLEAAGGSATVLIHQTARGPSDTQVTFRSPPVNRILEPGGTTNLCVEVTDAEGNPLADLGVGWVLDGPGALVSASTVTLSNGVACTDYQHPAGPVTQGLTVTITATAIHDGVEGSDAATLTPRWASIRIEAKPESEPDFVPATNSSVSVVPGEEAELRITLTGPGETPSDPPVPLLADVTRLQIESGGGTLDHFFCPGQPCTDVRLIHDENGQVLVGWDPQSFVGDTTIRVSYPPEGAGIAATTTFDRQVISISPQSATLAPGQKRFFTAAVHGLGNTAVTWAATGGTINENGLYTAGSEPGTYQVTARSVEDPAESATSTVEISESAAGTIAATITFEDKEEMLLFDGELTLRAKLGLGQSIVIQDLAGMEHVETVQFDPGGTCVGDGTAIMSSPIFNYRSRFDGPYEGEEDGPYYMLVVYFEGQATCSGEAAIDPFPLGEPHGWGLRALPVHADGQLIGLDFTWNETDVGQPGWTYTVTGYVPLSPD